MVEEALDWERSVRTSKCKSKEFRGSAVGRPDLRTVHLLPNSSASKPKASLLPDIDLQSLYSEQHIKDYQGLFVFIADSRK